MTDDKWNAQARKLALLGFYSQRCIAEAFCATRRENWRECARRLYSAASIRPINSARLDELEKVTA
jgi:hypothetical protein